MTGVGPEENPSRTLWTSRTKFWGKFRVKIKQEKRTKEKKIALRWEREVHGLIINGLKPGFGKNTEGDSGQRETRERLRKRVPKGQVKEEKANLTARILGSWKWWTFLTFFYFLYKARHQKYRREWGGGGGRMKKQLFQRLSYYARSGGGRFFDAEKTAKGNTK